MVSAAWLDLLAFLSNFMFCAATVYIALVEQPARMQLRTRLAVDCFRKSYPRALVLQPALLRTTFIASALRCWSAANSLRRAHAFNLIASLFVMVYSKKLIIPGSNELLASDQLSDHRARQLLQDWGRKHIVRTVVACFAAFTLLTVQLDLT